MWKWFAKKLRDVQREIDMDECMLTEAVPQNIEKDIASDERVTVRLDRAIGGHIVSVNKYNRRHDRYSENTYIIREDDVLEEALTAVFVQEKIS